MCSAWPYPFPLYVIKVAHYVAQISVSKWAVSIRLEWTRLEVFSLNLWSVIVIASCNDYINLAYEDTTENTTGFRPERTCFRLAPETMD